jgi:DNA replication protein DnaC
MPTLEQKQIFADPSCEHCEGRGVYQVEGEPYKLCDCHKRVRLIVALRRSGIPSRYTTLTVASYQPTTVNETIARVAIAEWVKTYPDKTTGLILQGPVGTCKTGLACACLLAIARLYEIEIRYWSLSALLKAEKQTFDTGEASPLKEAATVQLLALDDLGADRVTDWTQDCLSDLIDSRYSNGRKTIITTNLDAVAIKAMYGPRIADRLREMCQTLVLDGESRRA